MHRILRYLGMGVEKKDIGHLPAPAKIYVACLSGVGLALTAYCTAAWRPTHLWQGLFYLVCGILCSNLKVSLPGITGTLSVNYLFILAAVTQLSLADTVAIAALSGVAQLFWNPRKRPRGVQVMFTFASTALSSAATYAVYHAALPIESTSLRLFACSIAYFLSLIHI